MESIMNAKGFSFIKYFPITFKIFKHIHENNIQQNFLIETVYIINIIFL